MFEPQAWYDAWNAHDLEAILGHYDAGIRFHSPFAERLVPGSKSLVVGRPALRDYFAAALAAYPDLRFEPLETLVGAGSVVLRYQSVAGKTAAEMFVLNEEGLVVEVRAHYDEAPS